MSDKSRAAQARYRVSHAVEIRERATAYNKSKKGREARTKWQIENAENLNAKARSSYKTNPEPFRKSAAKWAAANRERELDDEYEVDHIMPLVMGGSNTPNNLKLLHKPCNQSKHSKHPVDFMQSRGFLL